MPLRGIWCGAQVERSVPSKRIAPALLATSPMMARSVVVLPTPLRPRSAADSPAFTSRFTPCKMCSLPIWTLTLLRLSMNGLFDVLFVLRLTEIGFAHALIVRDFLRITGGENGALRHDSDVFRDSKNDFH